MLSIKDLSEPELMNIFEKATEYKSGTINKSTPNLCYGLIFAEPSTRTYLSFNQAIKNLNSESVYLDGTSSSMKKGESLSDTVRMMREYSDIIILRSSEHFTSLTDKSWIINAGDGDNEHPTQALIDLFTIYERSKFNFKHICLIGDARHSRAMHSLLYGIILLKLRITITIVSPGGLELTQSIRNDIQRSNEIQLVEIGNIENAPLRNIDIFYLTRQQKERSIINLTEGYPMLNRSHIRKMKKTAIILHPLPRGNELPEYIDCDERALYFGQSKNGVPVRMAICSIIAERLVQHRQAEKS